MEKLGTLSYFYCQCQQYETKQQLVSQPNTTERLTLENTAPF